MARWLAAVILVAFGTAGQAQEVQRNVIVAQPLTDDFYGAGGRVEVRAPVQGDAVLAGQSIRITAPVAQDVIAAGETVTLSAPVGDDVRAAGREVRVENNVAGHVVAAGASVQILPGVRVGGFAWLFGREVAMEGEVNGNVKMRGDAVRLGGHVKGDAEIRARHVELLPGTRIDGDLIWSGAEHRFDAGAQVGGQIIEQPPPPKEEHRAAKVIAAVTAMFIITAALTGLVLYLLFPHVAARAAATVRRTPWLVLALGFAVLILTPFLIILLFASAIGWLLALILLGLYLVALPVSGLIGTYALTDWTLGWSKRETPRRAARAALFVLAIVVAGLIHLIPIVGWLFGLVLMLWGLGAILLLVYRTRADAAA